MQAFFSIGYWLQLMWDGRYRHTRGPYATYLVSRFWRLAPVMLVASGVVIAVDLAGCVSRKRQRRWTAHGQ